MRPLKKSFLFTVVSSAGLGVALLFISALQFQDSEAQPAGGRAVDVNVVNTAVTHIGRPVADHVLFTTGIDDAGDCADAGLTGFFTARQVRTDGTRGDPFIVPNNKALVITGVDWTAFATDEEESFFWEAAGRMVFQVLSSPAGPPIRFRQVLVTGATIIEDVATALIIGRSEEVPSGLVFFPGEVVCMRADLVVGGTATPSPGQPSFLSAVLRGYLIDQ